MNDLVSLTLSPLLSLHLINKMLGNDYTGNLPSIKFLTVNVIQWLHLRSVFYRRKHHSFINVTFLKVHSSQVKGVENFFTVC